MKRLFFFLLLTAVGSAAFILSQSEKESAEPNKQKVVTISKAWSQKSLPNTEKPVGSDYSDEDKERMRTDLKIASRELGFNIKLPKSELASAAGLVDIMFNGPDLVIVDYPNGLRIISRPRPPDDESVDFEARLKSNNRENRDGSVWKLTTIAGHKGKQIRAGFNYYIADRGTPRGPIIVWYDDDRKARISAIGPARAKLKELREVVASMY